MDDHERALWLAERAGALTASNMARMMDFKKGGDAGAKRIALAEELLAERLTGLTIRHYVTKEMQWGLDHEDEAIDAYETRTGNLVRRAEPYQAYVPHPTIDFLGCTPDGYIGTRGLAEVKCPTTMTHLRYLGMAEAPEEYQPQMTLQLICTGREWCEFISFDPRMKEERLRLVTRKWQPDEKYREHILTHCITFLKTLENAFELITTKGE